MDGRRIVAVAALLVLASACARSAGSATGGGGGTGTGGPATGSFDPQGPLVALTHSNDRFSGVLENGRGGKEDGAIGSYCWRGESNAICVDAVWTVRFPEDHLSVDAGDIFRLAGNATGVHASLWSVTSKPSQAPGAVRPADGVRVSGDSVILNVVPGRYTLEVDGQWAGGQVPFYFGVDVS